MPRPSRVLALAAAKRSLTAIAYCLRIKLTAIKYSSEIFRAYIYFRNSKGEDITFYKASNIVFTDYKKKLDKALKNTYLYYLEG